MTDTITREAYGRLRGAGADAGAGNGRRPCVVCGGPLPPDAKANRNACSRECGLERDRRRKRRTAAAAPAPPEPAAEPAAEPAPEPGGEPAPSPVDAVAADLAAEALRRARDLLGLSAP